MKIDPVRLAALDLLIRVDEGSALDYLLDQAQANLESDRDRAFLAELVRGTLQWRARYDHVIGRLSKRKPPKDPALMNILRLGLHQLLGMTQVPPYAATHEAGQLCRARCDEHQVGFVNGLLQQVSREIVRKGDEEKIDRLESLFDNLEAWSVDYLAAWLSHPVWLVERWMDTYGPVTAAEICEFNNVKPETHFYVLESGDPGAAVQAAALVGLKLVETDQERCLKLKGHAPRSRLADLLAQQPALMVQGRSVQAATRWLMEPAAETPAGLPVLDLCAAPGGKTLRLAAGWPGDAPILAVDNSPRRVKLLSEAAARSGAGRVQVVRADGKMPPFNRGAFSAVLLDGPCSGTGVLRHHPDGRWALQSQMITRNKKNLGKLSRHAADLVAPGGLLMYATCSLELQENEDVVDSLLRRREDFEPWPDASGRWRRTWLPHEAGSDGFFAARLRRKA